MGSLPKMYRVRQRLYDQRVEDIPARVAQEMAKVLPEDLGGQDIALAVGSRGIANIATIVAAVVAEVKRRQGKPFVFPAMGSHGGATPEGQAAILRDYGITEATVGCPIRATMEVVEMGRTPSGFPVYLDRNAAQASGIIVINRVKKHTDFEGRHGSGLLKMLTIGMGKKAQAELVHSYGTWGLRHLIPEIARVHLQRSPILAGLAILENGYRQTADLVGVAPQDFEETDARLLEREKATAPRLPFDQLDALILDEMGKNISGTGMETWVLGRLMIRGEPEPTRPNIHLVVVLDLTEESHGNAAGLGLANFTTERLLAKVNWEDTWTNVFTSTFLERARVPLRFPTDRAAVEAIPKAIRWKPASELRIVHARNTLHLEVLEISEALWEEAQANPNLEVDPRPFELEFDEEGRLLPVCLE